MQINPVIHHIVDWIKAYLIESEQNGFIVGISGGIDSALTSTLAAMSSSEVLALEMPIYQKPNQVERSKEQIGFLKKKFPHVKSLKIDLTELFDKFSHAVQANQSTALNKDLALANTRARLRMSILYYYAGLHNYLVLGTGNKVEDFGVGFFTKYGDGGVDLSPIADLTKTQVRKLAQELKIPLSIQTAKPTDGLWEDDRSDEDQLGASYEELEWAMKQIEEGKTLAEFQAKERELISLYLCLHKKSLHKINPVPICKIPVKLKG